MDSASNPLHTQRMARLNLFITLGLLVATLFQSLPEAAGNEPAADGGGEYVWKEQGPDLTQQQRQEIQAQIQSNIRWLQSQSKLPNLSLNRVALAWPLKAASGFTDYGYYGFVSFVDHDPAYPDQLLDYNCGGRTYDLSSGYNHAGTDIAPWPFAWNKMDNSKVQVVAAANGVIVYKQDGHYDRNCGFGDATWNAVYVWHGDGSIAWYGHLKNGTVTPKGIGSTVVTGEYLGVVGSSGNSTGPHLHFELHDLANNLIDPYHGDCNTADSWWAYQRPYYDSAINKLMTGAAPPVFPDCPNPEISNERTTFATGETIYFTTFYRDQLAGQQSQYAIYEPDGSTYYTWTHSSSAPFYAASYWYWHYTFGQDVLTGTWRLKVTYNGQTYQHPFTITVFDKRVYLPLVKR